MMNARPILSEENGGRERHSSPLSPSLFPSFHHPILVFGVTLGIDGRRWMTRPINKEISVRQSHGGDWMLKAKLPAHARFWNAGGTFADRPAELAHCAARVRLRARSLWLMSGMCGLSLEVTDLRVEPPSRECPLPMPQPFFCSVKKIRMATHVLERREQLRPVLKAAVDAEALKR